MLYGGRRTLSLTIKRSLSRSNLPKSFDVDLVTRNYEEQTRRAVIAPTSGAASSLPPLRLLLPPPNVTGRLNIEHALTVTINDVITRQRRVKGGEATWLPGMEHAGIATQAVVERELWRKERKTGRDVGREEFVRRCEEFASRNATVIRDQMARMGATLQWNSEYYTLDQRFSSAVTRAFVALHREGLISRDKVFVNWSPALQCSLSDKEVDKVDLPAGGVLSLPSPDGKGRRDVKLGVVHTVKYELIGGGEGSSLPVATTRPETIYADVALAVHPSHERANELSGRRARNPLDGRELPIIVDEVVPADKKGAVIRRLTPAHDRLDDVIASRHWEDIEEVEKGARERSCLDKYGRLRGGTPLDGIDRFDARVTVLSQLRSKGALLKSRKGRKATTVSLCSRTGDVIEPRQTHQWFLDCREMHAEAAAALRDGRLSVLPSWQAERLVDWFGRAKPWSLSRQLAWGQRVPAWKEEGTSEWLVACSEAEARGMRRGEEGGPLRQDKDVLDTWFSAGLIPLVGAGWTGKEGEPARDLSTLPLSLLHTGGDQLGTWVARMVMLTMRLSDGQLPFSRVILHGMVKDAEFRFRCRDAAEFARVAPLFDGSIEGHSRKMSKLMVNTFGPADVIDGISLEKMEERVGESELSEKEKEKAVVFVRARFPSGIPRCGPDALRFALLRNDAQAFEVPIDIVDGAKEGLRFCNKLWHLTSYAEQVRAKVEKELAEGEKGEAHVMDAWLRSRLAYTLQSVDAHMESWSREVEWRGARGEPRPFLTPVRGVHLAFRDVHSFFLKDLSEVYVESTKTALWGDDRRRLVAISRTLDGVMGESLRQLSVFMPFVSHFLHEKITGESVYGKTLEYSPAWIDRELEDTVSEVTCAAAAMRRMKDKLEVPKQTTFQGILYSARPPATVTPLLPLLNRLASVSIDTVLPMEEETRDFYEHVWVPFKNARLALKITDQSHREKLYDELCDRSWNSGAKGKYYYRRNTRRAFYAKEERERGPKFERHAQTNDRKSAIGDMMSDRWYAESNRINALIPPEFGPKKRPGEREDYTF